MHYLQITLRITNDNRPAAVQIYSKYKEPFLSGIPGAISKELLVREKDVQVLHGFSTGEQASSYLQSELRRSIISPVRVPRIIGRTPLAWAPRHLSAAWAGQRRSLLRCCSWRVTLRATCWGPRLSSTEAGRNCDNGANTKLARLPMLRWAPLHLLSHE